MIDTGIQEGSIALLSDVPGEGSRDDPDDYGCCPMAHDQRTPVVILELPQSLMKLENRTTP